MTRRPWTSQDIATLRAIYAETPDQPAPYTHAMAAMALQYAREKFAEEMDE